MPTINVIEYVLPHGKTSKRLFLCSDEQRAMADKIEARGLRFEFEVLRNGVASLTVHDPSDETDVGCELSPSTKASDLDAALVGLLEQFDADGAPVEGE